MLVQLLIDWMKDSLRRVFRCWPIVYRAAVLHGANEGAAHALRSRYACATHCSIHDQSARHSGADNSRAPPTGAWKQEWCIEGSLDPSPAWCGIGSITAEELTDIEIPRAPYRGALFYLPTNLRLNRVRTL